MCIDNVLLCYSNWYPFTVVVFYFLSPIPSLLARRHSDDSASNPCRELAYFLTTGIVVSAFALPIVLARAPVSSSPDPTVSTTPASVDTQSLDIVKASNMTTDTVVSNNISILSPHHILLSDLWRSLWPSPDSQCHHVPHHPGFLHSI